MSSCSRFTREWNPQALSTTALGSAVAAGAKARAGARFLKANATTMANATAAIAMSRRALRCHWDIGEFEDPHILTYSDFLTSARVSSTYVSPLYWFCSRE